jgi:hypothetical protein
VTTPNEYGVYPEGSCSAIENMLARAANQWVCARDTQLVMSYAFTGGAFYKLIGIAPGNFAAFRAFTTGTPNTVWEVFLNGVNTQEYTTGSPLTNNLFDYRWLTPFVTRNRLYANGKEGLIVFDEPTVPNSRMRPAGLPQLTCRGYATNSGAVVPAATTFTYAALLRRKNADGYAITAPPSVALRYSYGGSPSFLYEWPEFDDVSVGDSVELYRSAGISGADPVTDTGTSMRLVASYELTATDISNQYCEVFDRQPTAAPLYETDGIEIYTSPYQDGALGANLPPPVCKAAAQWGTYTFFGNITDDPVWTFDVPAGIINDFYDPAPIDPWVRANAVGVRFLTGTRTSGSPTITAVSAADIVGIKPGQIFSGTGFSGATVVSVGASTVTVSVNAGSSGSSQYQTEDQLEINGWVHAISTYLALIQNLANASRELAVYPSETVPMSPVQHNPGIAITLRPQRSGITKTITVRATNGQNYSPAIPEYNQTVKTITQTERPNLLRWSRSNQPEAVPSPNEAFVGGGQIIRLLPTTDCMWILCTDGAYRLSGAGGVWRTDLVDQTFVPVGPDACCVLNDVVYAYTSRGFASLSGTQVSLLTKGVIDAQFPVLSFRADSRIHLYANTAAEEILTVVEGATLGSTSTVYVYSTLYQQWSEYKPTDRRIMSFAMLQPANASDAPYPIFGTYDATIGAGQAYVRSWRPDAGTPLDGVLNMQPWYGGDPLTQKRFIDSTWIIGSHAAASIAQRVGPGALASGSATFKATQVDSRANMGIARAAAIGPSLVIGATLTHGNTTPIVLKGVSFRSIPLTTQQRSR